MAKVKEDRKTIKVINEGGPAGGIWFMGFLGAAVHLVGNVDGFWNIILALLKAAIWPALLVNRVFEMLRI